MEGKEDWSHAVVSKQLDLSEFPSCWTHGEMRFKSVGWGFLKGPLLRKSYRAVRLKDASR